MKYNNENFWENKSSTKSYHKSKLHILDFTSLLYFISRGPTNFQWKLQISRTYVIICNPYAADTSSFVPCRKIDFRHQSNSDGPPFMFILCQQHVLCISHAGHAGAWVPQTCRVPVSRKNLHEMWLPIDQYSPKSLN